MGKSTVADMLRDAGIPVFDADAVVHRLYAKDGAAVEPVGRLFPSVVKQGAIDRAALSKEVLNDTGAMKNWKRSFIPWCAANRTRSWRR